MIERVSSLPARPPKPPNNLPTRCSFAACEVIAIYFKVHASCQCARKRCGWRKKRALRRLASSPPSWRPWNLDKRLSLHPTAVANRIRCRNYGHAIRGAQGTTEPKPAMIATLLPESAAQFALETPCKEMVASICLDRDKHTEGQKTKLASGCNMTLDEAKTTETLVKFHTRTLDDSLKVANAWLLSI
ncbi:hypothetical protein FDECE_14685 [Fusarium decemcellulare]|nr:hypothetical protein FDECE_14685 [Fusarium decemcellulare]